MKPLVSPIYEYRVFGAMQIVTGLAFVAIAAARVGAGKAVSAGIATALIFALLIYLIAYRRYARTAVSDAPAPPTPEREESDATWARTGLYTFAQCVLITVVTIAVRGGGSVGGIMAGNGLALILCSRWIEGWERSNTATVLREPRFRLSGRGIRSRGVIDPRDFYVVDR